MARHSCDGGTVGPHASRLRAKGWSLRFGKVWYFWEGLAGMKTFWGLDVAYICLEKHDASLSQT